MKQIYSIKLLNSMISFRVGLIISRFIKIFMKKKRKMVRDIIWTLVKFLDLAQLLKATRHQMYIVLVLKDITLGILLITEIWWLNKTFKDHIYKQEKTMNNH